MWLVQHLFYVFPKNKRPIIKPHYASHSFFLSSYVQGNHHLYSQDRSKTAKCRTCGRTELLVCSNFFYRSYFFFRVLNQFFCSIYNHKKVKNIRKKKKFLTVHMKLQCLINRNCLIIKLFKSTEEMVSKFFRCTSIPIRILHSPAGPEIHLTMQNARRLRFRFSQVYNQ